jgi:hypothetical protein
MGVLRGLRMKIKALVSHFWVHNVQLYALLMVFLRVQFLALPNPAWTESRGWIYTLISLTPRIV